MKNLPVIDLSRLSEGNNFERENCKKEIIEASKEWGFFQVVNHGISNDILSNMLKQQMMLFHTTNDEKTSEILSKSYWQGKPSLMVQSSTSQAFHILLADVSRFPRDLDSKDVIIRTKIEEFAKRVSELALKIAGILEQNINESGFIAKNCLEDNCYLRLNRYPPFPISSDNLFGLVPHTDSDFLTILYQDHVGGLQLLKDGKWITVNPNPEAFIVNIGDLFQAWSNGLYKSVEHRVMTNEKEERFSMAYFLSPSYDTEIQSCGKPPLYRKFTFGEFKKQVKQDVQEIGYKIGLSRFLL